MLHRNSTYVTSQHDLPTQKGSFTLKLSFGRSILAIVEPQPGKPVLVVREDKSRPSPRDNQFTVVETGDEIQLQERWPDNEEILGTYVAGGKVLHLIGIRTEQSRGGAL